MSWERGDVKRLENASAWARNGVGLAVFLLIWMPATRVLPLGANGAWVVFLVGLGAGLAAARYFFGPRVDGQLSGPLTLGRFVAAFVLHGVAMVIAGVNVIAGIPPINWIAALITKIADALDPAL
jgi:hypothetical protein